VRGLRQRRRDERGVVAIVLALVSCFVLIPLAALAVDIGVQRVARTDMQSLADMVALDLARGLDGKTTAAQWAAKSPSLQQRAEASRDRNDTTVGHPPTVVAEVGTFDALTETFTPLPSTSDVVPNAVRVGASTEVDFYFASGTGGAGAGSGGTGATAIAQASTTACFQLGSWAATLNPSASTLFGDMLKPLLGSSTLTAVGYNGLATTRLSLLDLVKTDYIGVGTVNDLLTMNNLTVAKLYRASAQVLAAQGKTAQAQVFNVAAASVVAAATIDAGKLFGLSTSSDAALQTQFNALDILLGAAFLANGTNALDVDNLQTSLASVGVTSSTLKIIERPQRACDQGEAQTAQASLVSQAQVQVPSNPVYNSGGSTLRLVDNKINLGVNLNLAGAKGHLTSIACNPDTFDVDVLTDLATLSVDGRINLDGTVAIPKTSVATVLNPLTYAALPSILNVAVTFKANVSAGASTPAASAPAHGTVTIPPMTYDDHTEVGSGNHALPYPTVTVDPTTVSTSVTIAGLNLSLLTNAVLAPLVMPTLNLSEPVLASRVNPLVGPLIDKLNSILTALDTGLGINVGGADLYGLPYPNCQTPVLRG
jgi:uncharacterized membrane protein